MPADAGNKPVTRNLRQRSVPNVNRNFYVNSKAQLDMHDPSHRVGLRYHRGQLNALASNAVWGEHLLDTILFFNFFSLYNMRQGA